MKLYISESLNEIPVDINIEKRKRILWLGERKIAPDLKFHCIYNSEKTLEEYLLEEKIFPVILVWTTIYGERKYSLVKNDKK